MTSASAESAFPLSAPGSFSGHETFALRSSWLKKGMDGLMRHPDIFSREDALVELGVGKNMVRSIRHWCLATGVLQEGTAAVGTRSRPLQTSDIGSRLLSDDGWDPFLEDDASLWLLHWHLATNANRATTWYWVFNHVSESEFTPDPLSRCPSSDNNLGEIIWRKMTLEKHWPELLKTVPAIFVEKNGHNEDTYGKEGGCDRMWAVTAAGMSGWYSLPHRADERSAAETFRNDFKKWAERKGIEWNNWEIILLFPDD